MDPDLSDLLAAWFGTDLAADRGSSWSPASGPTRPFAASSSPRSG